MILIYAINCLEKIQTTKYEQYQTQLNVLQTSLSLAVSTASAMFNGNIFGATTYLTKLINSVNKIDNISEPKHNKKKNQKKLVDLKENTKRKWENHFGKVDEFQDNPDKINSKIDELETTESFNVSDSSVRINSLRNVKILSMEKVFKKIYDISKFIFQR